MAAKRTTSRPKLRDVFDLDQLTQIVELMKVHGLTEVDLEQDQQKIRIARGPTGQVMPSAPAVTSAAAPIASSAATEPNDEHIVTINSPMVGTFYAKAHPDEKPFIKVGDHVGPETIVCIIEAMKVFNEIPAEVSGQVVAVLVENEASVDFGKPLIKVDTSH